MKITFVYPDFSLQSEGKFYHGVAFLSAVLKRDGHRTSLIHITKPIPEEEFVSLVSKENPDLVAFSTTTNMFESTKQYARLVKKNSKISILCGGVHSTVAPEEAISYPEIDMICIGEGEFALLELCNKMDKGEDISKIRNIWVKKAGKIHRNPVRPLLQNLDELPFPDRTIYNHSILVDTRISRAVFIASRGCPYDCTYCCNHKFREIATGTGKYVRFRSVDNIIKEIELVIKERPVKHIVFHDDIFTMRKEWLKEFSRKYCEKINLPFIANSRANLLDREVISLLKTAGCECINMGIESGNDYIRQAVLNRNMTKEQIVSAFNLCKEYNIPVRSYNMVGLPFEDMGKILDTIKLNAQTKPDSMQLSIFFPYPGTKIYHVCAKNRFLSNVEVDSYFEKTTLIQPTISAKQIEFTFRNFRIMVCFYSNLDRLPKWIAKVAERILEKLFLSTNPVLSIIRSTISIRGKVEYEVKYYVKTIIRYYKEYGLSYVIDKILKKILKRR